MCRLASRDSRYRLSGTGAVTAQEAVGIPPDRTVRHGTTGETYCVMTSGVDGPARSPGRRPRRNQMQPATPTLPCGARGSRPFPGATHPGSGRRRRAASISPRERISPNQVPPQRFVPAVRPERPWAAGLDLGDDAACRADPAKGRGSGQPRHAGPPCPLATRPTSGPCCPRARSGTVRSSPPQPIPWVRAANPDGSAEAPGPTRRRLSLPPKARPPGSFLSIRRTSGDSRGSTARVTRYG